jgi:hypothetical protein
VPGGFPAYTNTKLRQEQRRQGLAFPGMQDKERENYSQDFFITLFAYYRSGSNYALHLVQLKYERPELKNDNSSIYFVYFVENQGFQVERRQICESIPA